jgi:hypothetical protein
MRCGLLVNEDCPIDGAPAPPSSRRGKTSRWVVPTFHIKQQSWRCRGRLHRPEYAHDPVRAGRHIGAVSDADAGHLKLAQAHVDQPLILDIEVRGALVEKQNAGLSIQGPRKQHPLLLAAESELPMSPTRLL